MHSSSTPYDNFLESIFKFSQLLIRGLIKGVSPDLAIFSSSSSEMHHFVMHCGSKASREFLYKPFEISIPANYGNNFGVNL